MTDRVARDPLTSPLSQHSNRSLMVKILAEMRVQTMILAEMANFRDNISTLRDDAMSRANKTSTAL